MLSRIGFRSASIARPAQRFLSASARRSKPTSVQNSGHTVDKLEGVYDNAFNRERLAIKRHAAQTAELWRKMSIYVVIPVLIVTTVNTWVRWDDHWEHQSHEPPINERKQYAYQNIRTKAFPWGDGNKTLFWNDNYNALPKTDE